MFEEIFASIHATQWGKRLGVGAIILFSLLLVFTLIYIPITWRSDLVLARGQGNLSTATPASSPQNTAQSKQIPDWHLFGNSVIVEQTTDLPITSLQLRLVGVIQAAPDLMSRVIISEAGQRGKVYQVGDNLPAGVRVNAITQDGVILENGGRMEKLPLQRSPLSFHGMPKKLLGEG